MLWKTMDVSGFSFHLAYDEIPMPRSGDWVVAEMFLEYSNDKETLEALQRVRGAMNVMFLSDMVTADGKALEFNMVDLEAWCSVPTKYDFPLECPTKSDELVWLDFWRIHCLNN